MNQVLRDRAAKFSKDSNLSSEMHEVLMMLLYDAFEEGSEAGYEAGLDENLDE